MKTSLLLLFLLTAVAYGDSLNVYVNGAGNKWYSATELEQLAKDYAKQQKIQFNFKGTQSSVWVNTSGTNIIARVSFSSGLGKPSYMADIDRNGKIATNFVGTAVCGCEIK